MKAQLFERESDPGICWAISDIAKFTNTSVTAVYRHLQTQSVDEYIRSAKSKNTPTPCLCGCGQLCTTAYATATCKTNHYHWRIEHGDILPYDWKYCAFCKKLFPRYRNINGVPPTSICCGRSCTTKQTLKQKRLAEKNTTNIIVKTIGSYEERVCLLYGCGNTFTVLKTANKKYCCTKHQEKAKNIRKRKTRAKNLISEKKRSTHCFRQKGLRIIQCKHYHNWLDEGFCNCKGFNYE